MNVSAKDSVFSDNYALRNETLIKMGAPPPKVTKTGTTIVGVMFKDGVAIGADSRATSGNTIADKHCIKLHHITDKIYACGAGTAADLDQVSRMVEENMKLLELKMRHDAMVVNAVAIAKKHLFRYQGHIGAYLIIGGIDVEGPHLFNIHAGGSSQRHMFLADGSGSLAAMGILEREFKMDMEEKDAVQLLRKAVEAGMHGDLASGNSYRFAVIKKEGIKVEENIVPQFCISPNLELKYDQPIDPKLILTSTTKEHEKKEPALNIVKVEPVVETYKTEPMDLK